MGYYDNLIAKAYYEEDGTYYFVGARSKRRFLSREDYERSRSRNSALTYSSIGLGIGAVPLGRFIGYEWVVGGGILFILWLITFGKAWVTANSVPADDEGSAPPGAKTGLAKLTELRDKGILSQEEFDTQTAQRQTVGSAQLRPQRSILPWVLVAVLGTALAGCLVIFVAMPTSDSESLPLASAVADSDISALVAAASEAATVDVGDVQETVGGCLLSVARTRYIDGDCRIERRADGTFQVMSLDGSYFATVLSDGAGAQVYWNETAGGTHAHSSLGSMRRRGACWENDTAQVCAWPD